MARTRTQRDSLGSVDVPESALYGPQTARATGNFPISGWTLPGEFIAAVARIKRAAAIVNKDAGRLDASVAEAIATAASEVIDGQHADQFPVDVFQTGSGTSTNMNVNEVLAARATQLLDAKTPVHPNDHVNMGQSSNDVIPTAMHLATAVAIHDRLVPALRALKESLAAKAAAFDHVVTIGRTHLMDAVPIRLGQEFSGFTAQIDSVQTALQTAAESLSAVALGGTAVGTGLNAPKGFAAAVCAILQSDVKVPVSEAGNHFRAQSSGDAALHVSGALRAVALAMGRVASDIRLLASGPRCGFGEIRLPALQPGSSIMPGKVNPVLCESVIQVACQVVGIDAAIAAGATGGVGSILQLNVAMPMTATNLLTAAGLLSNAADAFRTKCIDGIEADETRCRELVERSLAMVTVLAPHIGYDAAAAIAHEASESNRTIRDLCLEKAVLPESQLEDLLDARKQTGE